MNSEQIIKTLGYLTLILIAVYVLFGMLDMGGKGLASMAKSNKIVEGMDDRKLDRIAEKLGKTLESYESMQERLDDMAEDVDQVLELPEAKDILDLQIQSIENEIKSRVKDTLLGEGNKKTEEIIINQMNMLNALKLVQSGGGGVGEKISSGFGL